MSDTPCSVLQNRGHWAEDRMAGRCSFPIGPLNTWSNAAYLLAGGAVVLRDHSPAGWVMGAALCCLALGSGLYHGLKTPFANTLDWFGMYCVFGSLVVHGLAPSAPSIAFWMAVTGLLLALLFTYAIPKVSLDVQMGLLFWFAALPIAIRGDWRVVLTILGIFVVAYGCQVADRKGWTGRYGHAAWHVLTAIGIYLLYIGQG